MSQGPGKPQTRLNPYGTLEGTLNGTLALNGTLVVPFKEPLKKAPKAKPQRPNLSGAVDEGPAFLNPS